MATNPPEPTAERKDWPDPQRATGSEENDAKPANGIAVDGPELLPVRVGRQISVQQPDQRKGSMTQRLPRSSRTRFLGPASTGLSPGW